jgi:hypothetical protein
MNGIESQRIVDARMEPRLTRIGPGTPKQKGGPEPAL